MTKITKTKSWEDHLKSFKDSGVLKEIWIPKEDAKIIKKTDEPGLNWLRKQRDGVIGYIEDEINNLKTINEETDCLKHSIKQLVELNDEIYDIEHSEFKFMGPYDPKK